MYFVFYMHISLLHYLAKRIHIICITLAYKENTVKHTACLILYHHFQNTDWNKYDDRLMKAVERSEVDKVAAVLSKKGIIPTKLDVEGRSA